MRFIRFIYAKNIRFKLVLIYFNVGIKYKNYMIILGKNEAKLILEQMGT